MQEQQQPAISADSIKVGVTNDESFETLSSDIHGFGARHDAATCSDKTCGHPDHGNSTAGENLTGSQRAGERYDGERMQVQGMRTARDIAFHQEISKGGDDAISAIDHDPEKCELGEKCLVCNRVDESILQREVKVDAHGGGSSGPKKDKAGTKVCKVVGCGLTLCEHVRGGSSSKRGRPKIAGARSATVAFKVRPGSKQALLDAEAAQAIDELGFAVQNGVSLSKVRAFIASEQNKEAA